MPASFLSVNKDITHIFIQLFNRCFGYDLGSCAFTFKRNHNAVCCLFKGNIYIFNTVQLAVFYPLIIDFVQRIFPRQKGFILLIRDCGRIFFQIKPDPILIHDLRSRLNKNFGAFLFHLPDKIAVFVINPCVELLCITLILSRLKMQSVLLNSFLHLRQRTILVHSRLENLNRLHSL